MKMNIIGKLVISLLVLGLSPLSWGEIIVVTPSELSENCISIGLFEGDAGYGKSLDGPRIALYRALEKASNAGACHAVVIELNRGLSDVSGYSLVEGFSCPEEK